MKTLLHRDRVDEVRRILDVASAEAWIELIPLVSAILRDEGVPAQIERPRVLALLKSKLPKWPPELDRQVPKWWPAAFKAIAEKRVGETTTYGRYEAQVASDPRLRNSDGTQAVELVRRFVGTARAISSNNVMRVGVKGEPDLSGGMTLELPWGRLEVRIYIEVKTPTGKMKPDQELSRKVAERRGGIHFVVRTVEECVTALVTERNRLTELLSRGVT